MNASLNVTPPSGVRHTRGPLGGIMLIVIGCIALVAQFWPGAWVAYWLLPALGIAFFVWGLLAREVGLLVPGGVLTGIGVGAVLMQAMQAAYGETGAAGIFMFAFGGGWLLITLASWFIRKTVWWPLVVAAVFGVVGTALLVGGTALTLLQTLGYLWPLVLIGLGAWIAIRRSGWRPS